MRLPISSPFKTGTRNNSLSMTNRNGNRRQFSGFINIVTTELCFGTVESLDTERIEAGLELTKETCIETVASGCRERSDYLVRGAHFRSGYGMVCARNRRWTSRIVGGKNYRDCRASTSNRSVAAGAVA